MSLMHCFFAMFAIINERYPATMLVMPPQWNSGACSFWLVLFLRLCPKKETVTLATSFELQEIKTSQRLHIWHAYSTNETLSNHTEVDDLVALTSIRKKIILNLVAPGGINVSQTSDFEIGFILFKLEFFNK